jgi:oligopeptide transport system substrate-binding protein
MSLLISFALSGGGCFLDHEIEPYYGRVVTPRTQEFRWSDGGLPVTFDPAMAAAPPDTDAVRALFEGLTDYDPQTLVTVPAVAEKWESKDDGREWTFYLRRDARWSNGDPVTAHNFVRSWQRTLQLGERAPHAKLLANIAGARPELLSLQSQTEEQAAEKLDAKVAPKAQTEMRAESGPEPKKEKKEEASLPPKFGAEAIDDYILRVRLAEPDKNFPALVAHPVFRPVHDAASLSNGSEAAPQVVTNGAFKLSRADHSTVVLERAGHYWDAATVKLERVRFVASSNAEAALAAYRAGEVDAVTNAGFEPLALKLLAPYSDFRRTTYGALTYYSFNASRKPYDDPRVREALALAIDRKRISEDEMGGATEPAVKFLPTKMTSEDSSESEELIRLERDIARARKLLAEAGYPEGRDFPRLRLLINRNDQQRQVAESVAAMWRSALGVETEIIAKNWDEYEAAVRVGDYDVVRRGMVMQTTDEATNMRLMFEHAETVSVTERVDATGEQSAVPVPSGGAEKNQKAEEKRVEQAALPPPISSEAQALKELPAIPIYFASAYSLVKPYVAGFDNNLLDAPSLKRVQIDTSWKAPQKTTTIWLK